MKWSFVIQQKLKAALLLGVIMVLVVLSTLHSQHNLRGINKSFASIYQDRLMPAIDMVYLTENMYNKRLLLEQHLLLDVHPAPEQIRAKLSRHDQAIDSLVSAFELTYLVDQESKSLLTFKKHLSDYAGLEQSILNLSANGQKEASLALFEQNGGVLFRRTIHNLNELTQLQSTIGQQLVDDSRNEMASLDLITTFQIVLAIVVGILILSLIQSSRILPKGSQPFHLN